MSHGTSTNSKILSDLGKCLLEAARFGNTEEVRNLMSNGAPLITDWLGTTPLHLAAIYGHSSTAEILIKSGISRDCRTKVDKVPLHFACQHGHFEIVKILVNGGAHVNAADMLMMTPLHWAVEANNFDICLLLLKSGVKTILKNKFNKTPLSIAQDKGYGPIEKLLADEKFKVLQDIGVAHHNTFLERSINSVKICRPEDFGSNNSLWKKPKTRRFPMVAGTWTGGEAQNQERLDISERKKLGVYKRRSYHRDDLVNPFLCGLHVSTACSTNETVQQENNLTAFVSPSSITVGNTPAEDVVTNSEGTPLQKLKETVRQSTCPKNCTLVTSSSLGQVTSTVVCNVSTTMSVSYVTTTQHATPKNTIRVPKMTTTLENINQRPYLGNIPVVSSLVLSSLPPDIKAIPLNMTVEDLYKQQSMCHPSTNFPALCLPGPVSTCVLTNNLSSVSIFQPKDSLLVSPKKRPTVSAESHSLNPKKIQTELSKTRTTQTVASPKVTKVSAQQANIQIASPVTTSVQTTNKDGVNPTIPVNIPVNMLKEILGGIVTLHSVPVKSADPDGSMQTLAGITTEMGTIPLIPVSGEGGLQLIPLENSSSSQITSTAKSAEPVVGVTSQEKIPVSTNHTYFQHVLPAQHFLQASPSPYFVQPQVVPYPYPVAASGLSMLPGYDIANAILGNRHSIGKVSENGSIPTLPVHAGTPSPVLMPTGIYLQPGHPSFYQVGGPPTLLHPPTFPQFLSTHSQQAFARAQIHPTFLQQHAPSVLVQAGGQPTIIQQQMPRYVFLDPGGGVVSQVAASASNVSTPSQDPSH